MKLEFRRQIFENNQVSNFFKIFPVGAALLHADRRTDVRNLIVFFFFFCNFAKAPTNYYPRICDTLYSLLVTQNMAQWRKMLNMNVDLRVSQKTRSNIAEVSALP
jgi:hypothetical protein